MTSFVKAEPLLHASTKKATTPQLQLLSQGVRFLYLMPSVVEIWMFGDVSWTCCNAMLRKARGETGDEGQGFRGQKSLPKWDV